MSTYFLIDNSVKFYHENHILINKETDITINMQVAASRCLITLIKNQGKVVSQKELIELGWENLAQNVTTNTFYQTMLHLRRALIQSGCDKDLVKTVNRRGVVISDQWRIVETEDMTPSETEVVSEIKGKRKIFHQSTRGGYSVLISLILLAGISGILFISGTSFAFENYTRLPERSTEPHCALFINDIITDVDDVFKLLPTICTQYNVLYITRNSSLNKLSIIACDGEISKKKISQCKSFYFPELKNES